MNAPRGTTRCIRHKRESFQKVLKASTPKESFSVKVGPNTLSG